MMRNAKEYLRCRQKMKVECIAHIAARSTFYRHRTKYLLDEPSAEYQTFDGENEEFASCRQDLSVPLIAECSDDNSNQGANHSESANHDDMDVNEAEYLNNCNDEVYSL